jgi:hypothetical protein
MKPANKIALRHFLVIMDHIGQVEKLSNYIGQKLSNQCFSQCKVAQFDTERGKWEMIYLRQLSSQELHGLTKVYFQELELKD